MEIFSMLMAPGEGNPPVTGGFPSQKPVTRSFDDATVMAAASVDDPFLCFFWTMYIFVCFLRLISFLFNLSLDYAYAFSWLSNFTNILQIVY